MGVSYRIMGSNTLYLIGMGRKRDTAAVFTSGMSVAWPTSWGK